MKICFIGSADSDHIIKWANWFSLRGHEIHVISFTYGVICNAEVHFISLGVDPNGKDTEKLKYLLSGRKIKKIVDQIRPDIISVHYATSYGVAVALGGIKNYILSLWGSDIFEFPKKSILHRMLLEYSLKKAKWIFSTSEAMAKEAHKYTNKDIEITPFGVDMELFSPEKRNRQRNTFCVGTVKSMKDIYGIETIIRAISLLKKQYPDETIDVRIAGDGPQLLYYKNLSEELGLSDIITFLGRISQEEAAIEWANMDLGIIPSELESFGVAAIEAQASGTPLIISKAVGLLEVTDPEKSSIVVDAKDITAISLAIHKLFNNHILLKEMSTHARDYVFMKYEINNCFARIESLFVQINNRI